MQAKSAIQQAIARLVEGEHLDREEARRVMEEIMEGQATQAQIGSLLTALRMKGETVDEITGFAECMREKSPQRVRTDPTNLLDIVGTGGDGAGTFNISTASAIVAAAGGVRVAKHGNRAASGRCGSADVLEALGVNIQLDSRQVEQCLERIGLCFMFAVVHHPSMKHVAGPRREIGVRTVFNMLGPLTNPAGADRSLVGLYDRGKTELIAGVLKALGLKRAMVVSSLDGMDEISISAPTRVSELKDGEIVTYEMTPDDLGLRAASIEDVSGGDPETNAELIRRVFRGERGARRDIVLANAGACFYLAGRCSTLQEGVKLAADIIDSQRAEEKLRQLIEFTGELRHVS
jgi:anthranilate phosphoribosyltransferase